MSTLASIAGSDIISASRAVINANFIALNTDKVDINSSYANPAWITTIAGSKVSGNIAGNAATATLAATATALATPRTIAGVAFDGTANIALASTGLSDTALLVRTSGSYADPGWLTAIAGSKVTGNIAGNAATSTLAAAATALATPRTIAGVSFDGTANIALASTGLSDTAIIVRTSGSYADPSWITSLAGSKITGNIAGNAATATLAAAATILANARTIAGVSFNGSANIAIASTNLSDTASIVLTGQANSYTAGMKQLFASSATTAGASLSGVTADPSSVIAGDLWYRSDLGTFGFRNASAVDGLVAGARALTTAGYVPYVTAAGVLGSGSALFWDATNGRLGVGGSSPASSIESRGTSNRVVTVWTTSASADALFENRGANSRWYFGITAAHDPKWSLFNVNSGNYVLQVHSSTNNITVGTTTDDTVNKLQVAGGAAVTGRIYGYGSSAGLYLATRNTGSAWEQFVDAGGYTLYNYANAANALSITGTTTLSYSLFNKLATTGSTTVNIGTDGSTSSAVATQLILRAGAGQSSTNLMTLQNNAGTALWKVTGDGILAGGGNEIALTATGTQALQMASTGQVLWSSSVSYGGSKDLSFGRHGINIAYLGSGIANTGGMLYLRGVRPVGDLVGNLPAASGNAGMLATVTDANATTVGTTVAGGGSNTVLVWSNGTVWRIYAN